jgi:hypothetical protein|tara:strand:+ start:357 stop:686 length:330 start_codon:yes stop_codon:yes gene_type:complete
MKNRDIKGNNPSRASDRATAKMAKDWKPFGIEAFKDERERLMKSKWFRVEASEDEKKGVLSGLKMGWNLRCEAGNSMSYEIKRIMEWKTRTKADDSLLSEKFKKFVLKK